MTPRQRSRFYFPAWSTALRALRSDPPTSPEVAELHARVLDVADKMALADRRNVDADDLRHACHVVATGRNKSSTDLTNDECERIVSLFRILANPDDLGAMLAWNSPAQARRKRMLWYLSHQCVESYVVSVCREKFGCDDPATLTDPQLHQLHITLKNRPAARRRALADQPF